MAGETTDGARRLAEDAVAYVPRWPSQEWTACDAYVLVHGPNSHRNWGMTVRLRLGDDVERHVADVRGWFAERGRSELIWMVGDSATPADLRDRLVELGATPDPGGELHAGMVLDDEPPAVPGVEARAVATYEEFCATRELSFALAGMSPAEQDAGRARLPQAWDEYRELDTLLCAAFVDGQPVACGTIAFTPYGGYLVAAGTHPDWRGRGCYRALVRTRWEAAAARGTPLVAAQTGAMSTPILERLGFRRVATVRVLADRTEPR